MYCLARKQRTKLLQGTKDKMKQKKTRINVFLNPDVAEALLKKAEELGMTKTGIVSIAVSFGFQAIMLATDPELLKYFEAQQRSKGKHDKKAS